jgi:hypothetical protein
LTISIPSALMGSQVPLGQLAPVVKSLASVCPACQEVFAQNQVRRGQYTCGVAIEVFDVIERVDDPQDGVRWCRGELVRLVDRVRVSVSGCAPGEEVRRGRVEVAGDDVEARTVQGEGVFADAAAVVEDRRADLIGEEW